ncbi:uncharacterized protein LOC114285184 [Camellia sinensis]|uniref:uncharacterized protein LOC114285184 n=1 Tax=Camellia sinensis TaxID=4442 RepID=UPI001035BBD6|nr:uncharacterized protein LOC114285184 [Camellia sinensis]
MSLSYKTWVHHGETGPVNQPCVWNNDNGVEGAIDEGRTNECLDLEDELYAMLEDRRTTNTFDDDEKDEWHDNEQRENAQNFDKLSEDARRPLYFGCQKFTSLSFVIKMLHVKVLNKWSNKSFDMLLGVLKDVLLESDQRVPWTLYEAKKFLHDLGLGCVPIHACKYDCALFWKENANLENYPICKEPRYKLNDGKGKMIPHKILRHFPLTPRLQRLYMWRKTTIDMRWHKEKHVDDGILRHPADGEAWKDFDRQHIVFAQEPRNVRLGLATDGFNPFGNMSNSYSMWPVVVMPYNLPPWKYMKQPFSIMSLPIPGLQALGRDIDIYLRPLIDELKELWEDGVVMYDTSTRASFRMHAIVMWTINDFPAYGNLSRWSTKGYLACPNCNENVSSQWLRSKIGYIFAHRYLPEDHSWQKSKIFNGKADDRARPLELSGEQILDQLDLGTFKPFGKHPSNEKRKGDKNTALNWTKKSMFFELPYWKTLKVQHNLDVMHIEMNIGENLIGILLSIDGKNKDTEQERMDLENMKIRKYFHLKRRADGSFEKPLALYTLSLKERQGFCAFLKSIRYPDGYVANISRMRGYLNKDISIALFELGNYFQELCSKTVRVNDLEKLQESIVLILCKLLRILKGYVANRAGPEGSIVRAYIVKECLTFCSMYLGGIETVFNKEERNEDVGDVGMGYSINQLQAEGSSEATDELWSLANGPSPIVNIYSGCICNGIQIHTKDRDNCRESQNSNVAIQGDHQGMLIDFYGHLTKVWEMAYMCGHRVVLFQCKWFNSCSCRTFCTETHLTTINVRSRWYQNNPFVLPSQVQQVFYVNDTKLGEHWKVVERLQCRGIWNVLKLEDVDPNDNELPIPNDVF